MKETDFLFASSAVKRLENGLLTRQTFDAVINAEDYESARKILVGKGFRGFENFSVPEKALSDYMKNAYEETKELLGEHKDILDFLIIRNDFQNLKAIIKNLIAGNDDYSLVAPSLFDGADMAKKIKAGRFGALPELMRPYAEKAWDIITGTSNGQKLEIFIDRASFGESKRLAEKTGCKFIIDYVMLESTLINIRIALRQKRHSAPYEILDESLLDHSLLDRNLILEAFRKRDDSLENLISEFLPEDVSKCLKSDFSLFEKALDDMLIDMVNAEKLVPFGVSVPVSYYLSKAFEYKNLCIVTSFKKAGFEGEVIKERMRKLNG